jgi:hypothetical protein
MRRLSEFITEDTNQFGPGTDLVISLAGVLLVMIFISGVLYRQENRRAGSAVESVKTLKLENERLRELLRQQGQRITTLERGGNFKIAAQAFSAADFVMRPVTQLKDPMQAQGKISGIVQEYTAVQAEFPFIFVVGHSNIIDDPSAPDQSYAARLQRNWEYAGRRAGVIAGLLQGRLTAEQRERIVIVSTGEFDLKVPDAPFSTDNAWVEVIFGKEWKLPARAGEFEGR